MIRDISGSQKSIDQESKVIYDYFFNCASHESPQTVVKEFNSLFVQGKNQDVKVSKALNKILIFSISQKQFNQIFSYCFYLILNCWVINPELLFYGSELFNTIEVSNRYSSYDRFRKQLIELISRYKNSQEYLKLKATINIINLSNKEKYNNKLQINTEDSKEISDSQKNSQENIDFYLPRYTFIYQYLTPQLPELTELNKFILSLQSTHSKDFEIKLSKHIIYRFRLKQVAKMKLLSQGAGKVITKVDNPSLLSERAFRIALKQYIGKVDTKQTILEGSQKFVADHQFNNSYQEFKQDLYEFLTENIQPRNNNYQFKQKLKNKLESTFPQSAEKSINNTIVLQTCRQLFSFLVIETKSSPDHQKFADLIVNLGTVQVIKILIKIVLICPESKSDLERKISLIVNHYQLQKIQDMPWVIKVLEHLLIAFSIYYGNIDVSIAKSVITP